MSDKKTFKEKWQENVGSFKDNPEKARAAQLKSAETRKRRNEAKKKLQSGQLLEDAAAAHTADNPKWLLEIIEMYQDVLKSGDADPKTKMQAAEQLTRMLGTQAPKRQEVKVEDKTNIDDTVDELKNLGVNIQGLNVISGGKK